MVKATVYITSYNYGRYIRKAIDSVLNQTFKGYEIIVIDDGSTDNTRKILKNYEGKKNIRIFYQKNQGLLKSSERALKEAKGEYIIRLDADDYFDEHALQILVQKLNSHPEVGLVYPDYYEIDEKDNVTGIVRRKKIGEEAKVLDLPAHGAGTLIRKNCFKEINTAYRRTNWQDQYYFWIRFLRKFKPYNVNLPLFYYRKHADSATTRPKEILKARRQIKKDFAELELDLKKLNVLAVIPARGEKWKERFPALMKINGKPMISYGIKEVLKCDLVDHVVVATEDKKIASAAKKYGAEVVMRPEKLASTKVGIEPTLKFAYNKMAKKGFKADVVVLLFATSPLIKSEHIKEAVYSLYIYDVDSVISVAENPRPHYFHGKYGLQPIFKKRFLKTEREYIYEESGSLYASRADVIKKGKLLGKTKSHIILPDYEAIDIEDEFGLWIVKNILKNRKQFENMDIRRISRGY